MLCLDLFVGQASLHVPSYIPLHAAPPIIGSEISIHLLHPWMDGEPGLMGIIPQYLSYSALVHYPDPPMQGQEPSAIIIKGSYSDLALLAILLQTLNLRLHNLL